MFYKSLFNQGMEEGEDFGGTIAGSLEEINHTVTVAQL
jgi:hypothetical protein